MKIIINNGSWLCAAFLAAFCGPGCSSNDGPAQNSARAPAFVLGSVVIDADGSRTTYVQTIEGLDRGPFNNKSAIEMPGNGVMMVSGPHVLVGLAEEPTWVRYSINAQSGKLVESGRLSFLRYGVAGIDYGNTVVDDTTAVSVLGAQMRAVIWNPQTMEITGEVDLKHLTKAGYQLEVWTTASYNGLVYIPARWSDWTGARIAPGVSTTIVDPKTKKIVGVAEDDRCTSGGRVAFDKAGYAYVMGDGRNYSNHMFANAAGQPAPAPNCLLRIAPGTTDFEADYYYPIPSLTGGLESMTELETPGQGSAFAFSKMFYPDKLPAGMKADSFDFWSVSAHKMWRLTLANPPTAQVVDGVPFSAIGFSSAELDGKLYSGESTDSGKTTDVYELDPSTNRAQVRFKMDGYFYGLYKISR